MAERLRLDKYIATCTAHSRADVKKLVRRGLVQVDGQTAHDAGMHVQAGLQRVELDGQELVYQTHIYLMLNKPQGVVCATFDRFTPTVLDLLEGQYAGRKLFPAGRLDIDTTGFVLLTDDGNLAHQLLSPRKHVAKTYLATLDEPATAADVAAFAAGMDLGDFTAQPAQLRPLADNQAEVVLHEGKFHQVKRMFEQCGRQVLALHRTAIGDLALDKALEEGQWRELTDDELAVLQP